MSMSPQQFQILIISTSSLVALFGTLSLGRSGRLSFRYSVGWLTFFGLAALSSFLLPVASPISSAIGVTPGVIVTFVVSIALLSICIQLSISISGLQRQVRRLAEEIALRDSDHDMGS